jgi:two-component system, sensor histidine kinase YesM
MKTRPPLLALIGRHLPTAMNNRLFILISVIGTLLVMTLGLVISGIAGSLLYRGTTALLDTQTRQAVNVFDQYMEILRNTAMTASRQKSIKTLISGSYASPYESYLVYRDAYAYLKNVHEFYDRIHLHVFVKDIRYVMSSNPADVTGDYRKKGTDTMGWFQYVEQSPSGTEIISDFVPPVSSSLDQFAFVLKERNVYNWNTDGYIIASIDKAVLGDMLKGTQSEESGFLLVLKPDGTIAYSSTPTRLQQDFTPERILEELDNLDNAPGNRNPDFYFSSVRSEQTGWRFVSVTDKNYAKTQVFKFQFLMLLVAGVTISLLIVVARITSKAYTRPMERLIQFIHEAEKNEFAGQIELKSDDEVADLLHSFNAMIASVRHHQVLRKKAEIDALQKQINPHFLFNTFESIKALAHQGDTTRVRMIIEKLSDMFRYNTNRDGSVLTQIRDEVNHVRNYLEIQRVRYGSRIDVAYKVNPEVLDFMTPRFILQPLVENSISHALEKMKAGYSLTIMGDFEGQDIVFSIRDNGPGIPDEEMRLLKHHVLGDSPPAADSKFGIGLRNIHERLHLLYGPGYGLTLHSVPGETTDIQVRIPKDNKQKDGIEA